MRALRGGVPSCAELAPTASARIVAPMEQASERNRAEYETYCVSWQGIALEIRHCPSWFSMPGDGFVTQHIEIRSAGKAPLPVTTTGYRSHFINGETALAEFGDDPVAIVLWWLDEAAKSKEWQDQVDAARQYSLF